MDFDNRTQLNRLGMGFGQRILDRSRRQGDLHLFCKTGEVTLGYCYIRKNACSSFKQLFLDMGDIPYDPAQWPRKIDYMIQYQMLRSRDAHRCDRMVFVYRDPVARIVSLFKNKFIMRDGHEDLFANYAALAHEAPKNTTFRSFVQNYLRPDFRTLDLHVLPQTWHLKRFHYTDAIPIVDLHARMCSILGTELADAYFKKPVNVTYNTNSPIIPGGADIPAGDLAESYATSGEMPVDESFLTDDLIARISDLYVDDIDMIDRIEGRS